MSNRVDNFFKTKLKEHQLPPSAKAWDKIEANLSKKNKTILWFRLAAAIALIGIFTFAILQWMNTGEQQPQLVIENNKSASPNIVEPEVAAPEKEIPRSQASVDKTTKKSIASTPAKKERKVKPESTSPVKEQVLISQTKEEPKKEQVFEKAEAVIAEKPITLVFTLPSLKPKNELTDEVAATEEKKTALQKVVETANDIRTGDVLGDLREAKNELFALEFRKEKSKKQE